MTLLRKSKFLLDRGLAASLLAAAFLLVNACDETNSKIGRSDEPVSGDSCKSPGEKLPLKDGCNACTCGSDQRWQCTLILCEGGSGGTSGTGGSEGWCESPGEKFTSTDGCNVCCRHPNQQVECTARACLDGGSGGSAGSGGSGGSAGSAGSMGTGGSQGQGCLYQCLVPEVSWRWDGGLSPEHRSSKLTQCALYKHTRTSGVPGMPDRECSVGFECAEVSVPGAFYQSGLEEAFDSGVLYGHDFRPVDGSVLIVTYQGKELTVGEECRDGSPPNCIPIPDNVRRLVEAIKSLDERMLMRQECTSVFGP